MFAGHNCIIPFIKAARCCYSSSADTDTPPRSFTCARTNASRGARKAEHSTRKLCTDAHISLEHRNDFYTGHMQGEVATHWVQCLQLSEQSLLPL